MWPKIVCLCGSTKYYKDFVQANYEQTMAGNIVLAPGVFGHSDLKYHGFEIQLSKKRKSFLDKLHQRKIDMADEVLIIGKHIGSSTQREIYYAKKIGKPVRFWKSMNLERNFAK